VETGKELGRLQAHEEWVEGLAFRPDGHTLVSTDSAGPVYLWDVQKGKQIRQLLGHDGGATAVAYAGDGERFATTGADRVIRIFEAATGKTLHVTEGISAASLALNKNGSLLAAGDYDGRIHLWEPGSDRSLGRLEGHRSVGRRGAVVLGVAFAPGGRTLASAGSDGTIRLWDVYEKKELAKL